MMMAREFETRVIQITVLPVGEKIFCEMATHVSVEDEVAGEFVKVRQDRALGDSSDGCIAIDPDEWQTLRDAIDRMVAECREDKTEQKSES